ncbi:hypothetical protein OQA88_5439 [Cercophora sp. LCS_1]
MVWLSAKIYEAAQDLPHLRTFILLLLKSSQVGVGRALSDITDEGCLTEAAWQAMFRLLQSEYLRRVWMIQEIVMAKECWIMLYESNTTWDTLTGVGSMFQSMLPLHAPALQKLHPTLRIPPEMRLYTRSLLKMSTIKSRLESGAAENWSTGIGRPTNRWTLLDMLRKTWLFEATDKRDKVYAVIGLLGASDHCEMTTIEPDYSPDTTFDSLILSVFLESIKTQGGLEFLSYCSSATKDTTPSCMGGIDIGFNRVNEIAIHTLWDAGGMFSDEPPTHLRLRITRLGVMHQVLGPWPGERDLTERLEEARNPKEYLGSQVVAVSLDDVEAYWHACKTLAETALEIGQRTTDEALNAFYRAFNLDVDLELDKPLLANSFRRNSQRPKYDFEDLLGLPSRAHLLGLHDQLRLGVTNASSSRLNKSLLCWVPPTTKQGDLVCVVHGYRFPMTIRQAPGSENHYWFLGTCYVQGYMDGKALGDVEMVAEDLIFS